MTVLLFKWRFKLQIVAKSKRWFTAAAANDPTPANTRLTVTIGPAQCYTHAATKKTD
jgi:hypothetical protein